MRVYVDLAYFGNFIKRMNCNLEVNGAHISYELEFILCNGQPTILIIDKCILEEFGQISKITKRG